MFRFSDGRTTVSREGFALRTCKCR